jgi:hypothetical protein
VVHSYQFPVDSLREEKSEQKDLGRENRGRTQRPQGREAQGPHAKPASRAPEEGKRKFKVFSVQLTV